MSSPINTPFNPEQIRADFPIFNRQIRPGISLVYLDSTATSQKPTQVIDAMSRFYAHSYANIHRGIHLLAEESTAAYEEARNKVAAFIGAAQAREIVFTRNATESINLVAYSWGRKYLKEGDIIILTEMEHHSNLVPWQILAEERGLRLEFIPITPDGLLDLEAYRQLLKLEPKLVAFTQMSNVLGTITPAREIVRLAHAAGALTLVDGAQSVPHIPVDVKELDADFLVFSAHKMCGPSGIGVLYGREKLLQAMPPFLGGGDMIKRVSLRSFSAADIPQKFEAGTPSIAEAVGFGAAIDYLSNIGMQKVETYEHDMIAYVVERLEEIPGVRVLGPTPDKKGAVASFVLDGLHPHDISQILDTYGVAIRAGHHCAQPLHEKLQVPASARASFYIYNTPADVDRLVDGIYKAKEVFS